MAFLIPLLLMSIRTLKSRTWFENEACITMPTTRRNIEEPSALSPIRVNFELLHAQHPNLFDIPHGLRFTDDDILCATIIVFWLCTVCSGSFDMACIVIKCIATGFK